MELYSKNDRGVCIDNSHICVELTWKNILLDDNGNPRISQERLKELVDADTKHLIYIRKPYESRRMVRCTCGGKPQVWVSNTGYTIRCNKCSMATPFRKLELQARRDWNNMIQEKEK